MSFYETFDDILKNASENSDKIIIGTVKNINPFEIRLDQKMNILKRSCIFTAAFAQQVKDNKICISDKLIIVKIKNTHLIIDKWGDFD